jgi:hypothetical protein
MVLQGGLGLLSLVKELETEEICIDQDPFRQEIVVPFYITSVVHNQFGTKQTRGSVVDPAMAKCTEFRA